MVSLPTWRTSRDGARGGDQYGVVVQCQLLSRMSESGDMAGPDVQRTALSALHAVLGQSVASVVLPGLRPETVPAARFVPFRGRLEEAAVPGN
jgi:hypothetical protein